MTTPNGSRPDVFQLAHILPEVAAQLEGIAPDLMKDTDTRDMLNHVDNLIVAVQCVDTPVNNELWEAARVIRYYAGDDTRFAALATLAEIKVLVEHPQILIDAANRLYEEYSAMLYTPVEVEPLDSVA